MKRFLLYPILLIVLLAAGVTLTQLGFSRIETLRQMERIPRVQISELIPGEVNISGRVRRDREVVIAPDSNREAVYYHYTVERRTRDSDGNTQWRTERSETRMVPFLVEDESASVRVNPDRAAQIVGRQMVRRTEGNRRYTEYRIDPGHEVFVMGMAERVAGDLEIGFAEPGNYRPILSTRSEEEERGSVGLMSVLLTVGGLLGLSLAMYMLTRIVGIHRTLTYLVLVTLTLIVALMILSVQMMGRDVEAAYSRVAREQEVRAEKVQRLLRATDAAWEGDWSLLSERLNEVAGQLSASSQEQIRLHRINLARSIRRAEETASGWVARRVASRQDVPELPAIQLTKSELESVKDSEAAFSPSRLAEKTAWILFGIGVVGAVVLAGYGFRRIIVKRWIENIPTVKTRGVVYGMNEVKGEAVIPADTEVLKGPVSGQPCCYYRYIIRERRRRNRKTEWVTIKDEIRHVPFLCRDSEGDIPIDAAGADVILQTRQKRRSGRQQHIEYRVPMDAELYVLGSACIDPHTHDRLIIAGSDDKSLPFLISDYSDRELIARKASAGFLALNVGFSFMLLASFALGGMWRGFDPATYMLATVAPLIYLILFMIALTYNDLVYLRRRCEAMWANIDVALKKRFDLIPQLQAAAKGYLKHEQGLQEQLTQLRTQYQSPPPEQAGPMMAEEALLLQQVMGSMENYPDLKGDTVMADLFTRIRDLEDEVALMREGYNHAVEVYDTRLEHFPEVLLAKGFGFVPRRFFESAAS